MHESNLIYTKEGHIGIITINRPKQRNAITTRMGIEFSDLVKSIKKDNGIRAVILTAPEWRNPVFSGVRRNFLDSYKERL